MWADMGRFSMTEVIVVYRVLARVALLLKPTRGPDVVVKRGS
jgi:hypothetical protein